MPVVDHEPVPLGDAELVRAFGRVIIKDVSLANTKFGRFALFLLQSPSKV